MLMLMLVCASLQNGLMSEEKFRVITWSYILDRIAMYWEVHWSKGNDLSCRIIMHGISIIVECYMPIIDLQ